MTKRVNEQSNSARCALLWLCLTTPALAHEFWIEPKTYQLEPGERIRANLFLGQNYQGAAQSYLPNAFEKLVVVDGDGERAVKGRLGDLPAIRARAKKAGLHVIAYQSTNNFLEYRSLAKFEKFAATEGIEWAIAAHRSRGLPENGFRERYTRHAKALLKVGDGAGDDRAVGMRLELVVVSNPYTSNRPEPILVQLLWQGEPLADAQVSIFRKVSGQAAERSTVRTDANGKARIPRGDGGRFLLNAVHLVEPWGKHHKSTVWHSLWASTTYELPQLER